MDFMMQRPSTFLLLGALLLILPACDPGASLTSEPTDGEAAQRAPAPSRPPDPAPSIGAEAVKRAVATALATAYEAGYDESNRCWRTVRGEGDEATPYCMRPLPEQVVHDGGATWVYVALASASDIRRTPDYLYGQVDPGVMDAFKLRVSANGRPEVVARGLGLAFGTAGDCGCANARFVQVGPRVHGWMFTSGGTWQGTTIGAHALVAPVGAAFKDVAALPRYVEGDPSLEYRLAIAPAGQGQWYPLRLSQWRDGRQVSETPVAFDPATERYRPPGTL